MQNSVYDIINMPDLTRDDVIFLLSLNDEKGKKLVFDKAAEVRFNTVENKVYLRGLIEYSNACRKDCLYCGIRASNKNVERYTMREDDVLKCAEYALEHNYGSIVIQSGEKTNPGFVESISHLLKEIKELSSGKLGITLSCGEQSKETYQRWFDSGAHRYLLRFESSDPGLYNKIHPPNKLHDFGNRMVALKHLRETGYQVGSGMMIGLPGQTVETLADDLLLLKHLDVDMVGMGPYIEHADTPLYNLKNKLRSKPDRLQLSLLTIALLRIIMPDINIAASTALDSLSPDGRQLAIKAGSNVLMPNITPVQYRENYFLYDNKPYLTEADALIEKMNSSATLSGFEICFSSWGDSKHFEKRV
jgi:biotin synthase